MKVALIGATGYVGSVILAELLQRGHRVTALARNPDTLTPHPNLTARRVDVLNSDELSRILNGHEAVISAFNPGRGSAGPEVFAQHVAGHNAILAAVNKSDVKRLLAVGGAASLKTASGQEYLD